MENSVAHLAHVALWMFFIGFVFACIGVVATVMWIARAVTGTRDAVVSGAENVSRSLKK